MKQKSSVTRLALLMRPYMKTLIVCVVCVIIVNAAELVKPLVAAVVIDDFIVAGKEQSGFFSIWGMGIIYFAIVAAGSLLSMTQVRLIARISQSILAKMRQDVFKKIMLMPMKTLDKHGTGRLITRATNDVETVNEFYSDVFLNLFKDIFLLLGIIIVMLVIDPMLALVAFTGVPIIVIITLSLKKVLKQNFKRMKTIIGQINGFFAENVGGMRIVQAFNRQIEKLSEFRALNKAYFQTTRTQVMLNTFLRPTMEVINTLVIALLIAYGYHRISGGTLNVGILYAFTNYVKQFFEPINDLAEKYTTVQSAFVSTDRIYEILDEQDIENPHEGAHSGSVSGEVEFRDVWFAYNDEDWVLRGVSFKVNAGEKAAFVGATGVGKSTIISLIARYYTAQKGEILIDGVPVGDWQLHDLRRGVATVLQDVFLFTGDIEQNIDMHARLELEQIETALETACADGFVREIGGIGSPVTEQGLNFSTGQRQLLSFARAIAHEPGVLVLDEATAHIDTVTEELVRASIERISKGRTSIFIAHRLSTIRSCDAIFVMVGGVIAESGTHEALMSSAGVYAGLVDAAEE